MRFHACNSTAYYLEKPSGNKTFVIVTTAASPGTASDDDERGQDEEMALAPNTSHGNENESRYPDAE